jgi:hypothetical protein
MSKVKQGIIITYDVTHYDKNMNLIYSEKTRTSNILKHYDIWRSKYCNRYRKRKLLESFRLGRINILILIYSFLLWIGDTNASSTKTN